MSSFTAPLKIQNGIVTDPDGTPHMFVSADYPYYRDYRENWANRLSLLKEMGINVVSAYIPWRHHQLEPETAPDFSGSTQPNRDVLGFFSLCKELGLAVIAKPGPFIHAETNYGGLPNWICPLKDKSIEPLMDANGGFGWWSGGELNEKGDGPTGWPLPAPFSPEFLRQTREWMTAVGEQVIAPHQSPRGAIVAVQIGNEGIYSNGQHAPWAYDYSPSALTLYREFLNSEYQTVDAYNTLHGTEFANWDEIPAPTTWATPATPLQMQVFVDWGKFQAWYMDRIFKEWAAPLKTSLPVILNQNPPLEASYGLDAWLTRVEPEAWSGLHYGFTNWVGDVSAKPSAFDRYLLTAKRYPGINMEENWGFAELYDPAYIDAATSFYQMLVIVNGGATGFNIYTGIGTGHKDTNLEVVPKAPYPDAAPITADGEMTPKATIVRWMADFFAANGEDFLACRPLQPIAFGVDLPLARVAAWAADAGDETLAHGKHLEDFQREMRAAGLDYGILNLERASLDEMQTYPQLVIAGGPFMAKATQQKLADYVRSSGKLTVMGEIPTLDERFEPCDLLSGVEKNRSLAAAVSGYGRARSIPADVDVWVRSYLNRDLHFVTILIPDNGKTDQSFTLTLGKRQHTIELSAARSGGATLKIENGQVTDYLLKGHNGFLNCSVPPRCRFDAQVLGADQPGDFARIGDWTAYLAPENK